MAKLLDIIPGEGGRTQITVLGTAVINAVIAAWEFFGWAPLPPGLWEGINVGLGLLITLFLGDKIDRTEAATKEVAMKQGNETPVVVVTPSAGASVSVSAKGADVIRT